MGFTYWEREGTLFPRNPMIVGYVVFSTKSKKRHTPRQSPGTRLRVFFALRKQCSPQVTPGDPQTPLPSRTLMIKSGQGLAQRRKEAKGRAEDGVSQQSPCGGRGRGKLTCGEEQEECKTQRCRDAKVQSGKRHYSEPSAASESSVVQPQLCILLYWSKREWYNPIGP